MKPDRFISVVRLLCIRLFLFLLDASQNKRNEMNAYILSLIYSLISEDTCITWKLILRTKMSTEDRNYCLFVCCVCVRLWNDQTQCWNKNSLYFGQSKLSVPYTTSRKSNYYLYNDFEG